MYVNVLILFYLQHTFLATLISVLHSPRTAKQFSAKKKEEPEATLVHFHQSLSHHHRVQGFKYSWTIRIDALIQIINHNPAFFLHLFFPFDL